MMHLATRAASRLPRPWNGLAFAAAPPAALRHSSNTSAGNTSADEFVKQAVDTQHSPHAKDDDAKKPSSIVVRKVGTNFVKFRRINSPLVTKIRVGPAKPWKLPAETWPEKPLTVFSRRRDLNVCRLPLGTTVNDIILSIDNAIREHKVAQRASLTADIVIRPGSNGSEEVDAVIDFLHPDGAQTFRDLIVHRKFKVRGVVPKVSLNDPRDPSELPQPSGKDEVIAQSHTEDRADYFTSPNLRKVVRRTHLIYN